MINVAVIGYGYWGPNLARNFFESDSVSLSCVADLDISRLASVSKLYPGVKTSTDIDDIFTDAGIDAVVIATPVHTHFKLALRALEAGKHVWVEKPFAENADQAKRLIHVAEAKNLTLMVDHTFVYTGAVRKIYELIRAGELGKIHYYDSSRINLGLFQRDVNVIWDLAVHDFSILDYIFDERPVAVSANGISHLPGSPENIAYITLFYDSGMIAHVSVNWLAPVKLRRMLIGGSKKMIVYDDLLPSEKVRIYDKGIEVTDKPGEIYNMQIGYRLGDMWAPQLDTTEALRTAVNSFLGSIEEGRTPVTESYSGLRIVELLEAASSSMRQRGTPVDLHPRDSGS
jgi:predicted dehydrogenase